MKKVISILLACVMLLGLFSLTVSASGFTDVSDHAWYAEAVDYAVANGLMNGVGNGRFAPDDSMTRAMLVTVLWRYEGSPVEGSNVFSDVPSGTWFSQAVAWANHNGIVKGVGNGRFDPDGTITREQLAVILYRYTEMQGLNTDPWVNLNNYADGDWVSAWAGQAFSWAVASELINGSKMGRDTYLMPRDNATRAQVAAILMRYITMITAGVPFRTEYFAVTLPNDWDKQYVTGGFSDYSIIFYHHDSVLAGYGGKLFSISLKKDKSIPQSSDNTIRLLGELHIPNQGVYYVIAGIAKNVQYSSGTAAMYKEMMQDVDAILQSFRGHNGTTFIAY